MTTTPTTPSPFARSLAAIDADLAAQVERREKGIDEVLHGLFMAERATNVIDRLLAERTVAAAGTTQREAVRSR